LSHREIRAKDLTAMSSRESCERRNTRPDGRRVPVNGRKNKIVIFFPFFNVIITFMYRLPGKRLLMERYFRRCRRKARKRKKKKKKTKKGKQTRKLDFPHSEPVTYLFCKDAFLY